MPSCEELVKVFRSFAALWRKKKKKGEVSRHCIITEGAALQEPSAGRRAAWGNRGWLSRKDFGGFAGLLESKPGTANTNGDSLGCQSSNLPSPETLGGNALWTVRQQQGGSLFDFISTSQSKRGYEHRCHTHGAISHHFMLKGQDAGWECRQLPSNREAEITVPHPIL